MSFTTLVQVHGEQRPNPDGTDRQLAIKSSRIGETLLLHHQPESKAHPPMLMVRNRKGITLGHIGEPEASEIIAAMQHDLRVTAVIESMLEFPRSKASRRLVVRISGKAG